MQHVDDFPHEIEEQENIWIELKDGCRLAARVWMPRDAAQNPVPAILEYLPYRKLAGTEERDALTHPYFAGNGYACLRVDTRGNGESDGLMSDEYTAQELADGVEVIDWIAEQDWCSGAVGMMGISWGGFNALQVAALQPEPLKAIITLCSTDDRYADDIHFKGGCLLNENLGWGATMLSYSSRPPDPAIVGENWREMWLERLENEPLLPEIWLQHQTRDDYWKHGSVCEDYSSIRAATLAIGGWGDAYKNAVWRIVKNLDAPAKGIIGPWLHKYPHFAAPLPQIGFLQEALRWWDRWLKGIETGVEDDPAMRVYVMDSVRPKTSYEHRPGHWVASDVWPPAEAKQHQFHFSKDHKLRNGESEFLQIDLCSRQDVGADCGEYCAIWLGPDMPGDQRHDDAISVCFDTEILEDEIAIAGMCEVALTFTVDKPEAQIAVRLNDIWPDGAATRITYGVLNLTHRDSHGKPEPMVPGKTYKIHLKLDDIAYTIPAGHRLRVAISSAYWPLIWPSPEQAKIRLLAGSVTLANIANLQLPNVNFAPAEGAPAHQTEVLRESTNSRVQSRDLATGEVTMTTSDDFGNTKNVANGMVSGGTALEIWRIMPNDPSSAQGETVWTQTLQRENWEISTTTSIAMRSDIGHFYLQAQIKAFENGKSIFEKKWNKKVPRNLL